MSDDASNGGPAKKPDWPTGLLMPAIAAKYLKPGTVLTPEMQNFLHQQARKYMDAEREPPTKEELIARCLAIVFDCGQRARQNSPKGTRLKNVPRETQIVFARWRDRSAAGHPMFDLYAGAVDEVERLTGCRTEAERLCEAEFAKGFRKRYRCVKGKFTDATPEEEAIARLASIGTAEGDGKSMFRPSRTSRARRAKKKLGVSVTLRYAKPAQKPRDGK
jgi:hypothetical protein